MRKLLHCAAMAALLLAAGAAQAQSCNADIDRVAQQYDLSPEIPTGATGAPATPAAPPATIESRGLTETQRLGKTTSSDTSAPTAMPPSGSTEAATVAPVEASNKGAGLTAEDRAKMQGLLTSARQAERDGKDDTCRDQVKAAEAVPGVPGARRAQ